MDRDQILASLRERILAFATLRVSKVQAEDLAQEVLREENDEVVDAFLATHSGFHRAPVSAILARRQVALPATGDDLRLWPHRHGTDGFFAAVLERGS